MVVHYPRTVWNSYAEHDVTGKTYNFLLLKQCFQAVMYLLSLLLIVSVLLQVPLAPGCSNLTCHNGGVCQSGGLTPVCSCPGGFAGDLCEITVQPGENAALTPDDGRLTEECRVVLSKGLVSNYGEWGYKMGKSHIRNFLAPPPCLKSSNFVHPLLQYG